VVVEGRIGKREADKVMKIGILEYFDKNFFGYTFEMCEGYSRINAMYI
jgi:hypothetical protein